MKDQNTAMLYDPTTQIVYSQQDNETLQIFIPQPTAMTVNDKKNLISADVKDDVLYTFFMQHNDNTLYFYNKNLVEQGHVPTLVVLDDEQLGEKLSFLRSEIDYQRYILSELDSIEKDSIFIPNKTAMPSTQKIDTLLSANYKNNILYTFYMPDNKNYLYFYDQNHQEVGFISTILQTPPGLLNFLISKSDIFKYDLIRQHNNKAFEFFEEKSDEYNGVSDYL